MITNREIFTSALNRINVIAGTSARIGKDKQGWFIVDDTEDKTTTFKLFTDCRLTAREMYSYLHGVEETLTWCRVKNGGNKQ